MYYYRLFDNIINTYARGERKKIKKRIHEDFSCDSKNGEILFINDWIISH